jgi:ABC-type lipoprotein export system ATPase subunit
MEATHSAVETEALWPLREITVRGLFGSTNLSIDLDPEITILTGENGSGKSTLLRAAHLLSTEAWEELQTQPIDRLELNFESDIWLSVDLTNGGPRVFGPAGQEWVPEPVPIKPGDPDRIRNWAAHGFRSRRDLDRPTYSEPPEWLAGILERLNTKYVSARRLEHRLHPEQSRHGGEVVTPVVDQFADDLAEKMRHELSRFAAASRNREKVLPSDIVRAMQEDTQESVEDLAQDVDRLKHNVKLAVDSLTSVGLLQEENPDAHLIDYPRDDRQILLAVREVYRTADLRYESLQEMRDSLEFFTGFLNDRLSNKSVQLNTDAGIEILLQSGESLKPSQLSSGEQQLIALTYELLFDSEERSVVFLDEPELSLHVAWLQGLASAFQEIGRRRSLQFIVATHSPSVLAGFLDQERSLDEMMRCEPV